MYYMIKFLYFSICSKLATWKVIASSPPKMMGYPYYISSTTE